MDAPTLLLYIATVLPLICTPGPDMLFVASQALAGGTSAGLRATTGICLGYGVHSALVALGVAAIVAASPLLFGALRWLGVAYLGYLSLSLLRLAMRSGALHVSAGASARQLRRGFATALLNPKGMLIYFAILPQFVHDAGHVAFEASVLSAVFVGLCGIVYSVLSTIIGYVGNNAGIRHAQRRCVEGIGGALLLAAAGWLAVN